jgi:uncharacterized protein
VKTGGVVLYLGGMKRGWKFFNTAASLLVVIYIAFYFFQEKFIFQATPLPPSHAFQFASPYQEHFIETFDGNKINALHFKSTAPSKGLVIYFHGNADNLQRWGNYAIDFTELGWDILMIDYRGYGKSTGTPGEENYYQDAETVYQWSKVNIPFEKVVIYGRSLGSAIASNLAAKIQPVVLILETPFDRLNGAQLVYKILPFRYTFSTSEHLQKVKCAVFVFHGTNDGVVSLRSAERLKSFLKPGDQFVVVEGGSHNDLRKFEEYHSKLRDLLR